MSCKPQINLVFSFFTVWTVNPNDFQQGIECLCEVLARFLVIPPDHSETAVWGSKSTAKDIVECIQIAIPVILAPKGYLGEGLCKTTKVAELGRVDDNLRLHTLAERRTSEPVKKSKFRFGIGCFC